MYFPSKRDRWMTVILWLFAIMFIVPPIFFPELGVWMVPEFLDQQWIRNIFLLPIGFFLIWIWFKTGYTIERDIFTIQYGPYKKRIKIEEIHSIRETRNPFTAPALSMEKLEIHYASHHFVVISPENQTAFCHQLRKQNANIKTDSA